MLGPSLEEIQPNSPSLDDDDDDNVGVIQPDTRMHIPTESTPSQCRLIFPVDTQPSIQTRNPEPWLFDSWLSSRVQLRRYIPTFLAFPQPNHP